jgi:hypothetical protein
MVVLLCVNAYVRFILSLASASRAAPTSVNVKAPGSGTAANAASENTETECVVKASADRDALFVTRGGHLRCVCFLLDQGQQCREGRSDDLRRRRLRATEVLRG